MSLGQLSIQGQMDTNNLARNLKLDRAAQLQDSVENQQRDQQLNLQNMQEQRLQGADDRAQSIYDNQEQWVTERQQIGGVAAALSKAKSPEEFEMITQGIIEQNNGIDGNAIMALRQKGLSFETLRDFSQEAMDLNTQAGIARGYIQPQAPTKRGTVVRPNKVGGKLMDVMYDDQDGSTIRILGESKPSGSGTTINVGGGDAGKFEEQEASNLSNTLKNEREEVFKAEKANNTYRQIFDSLERSSQEGLAGGLQGIFSQPIEILYGIGESIGITNARDMDEAKFRNSLALELARTNLAAGERPTDADIKQLINQAPNSKDTFRGAQIKIAQKVAVNNYRIDKMEAKEQVIQSLREQKIPITSYNINQSMASWVKDNPVDNYYRSAIEEFGIDISSNANKAAQSNPQNITTRQSNRGVRGPTVQPQSNVYTGQEF